MLFSIPVAGYSHERVTGCIGPACSPIQIELRTEIETIAGDLDQDISGDPAKPPNCIVVLRVVIQDRFV